MLACIKVILWLSAYNEVTCRWETYYCTLMIQLLLALGLIKLGVGELGVEEPLHLIVHVLPLNHCPPGTSINAPCPPSLFVSSVEARGLLGAPVTRNKGGYKLPLSGIIWVDNGHHIGVTIRRQPSTITSVGLSSQEHSPELACINNIDVHVCMCNF